MRQLVGLGRNPRNLAEYIEASQNYQEALLADKTIGMRLSPRAVAGYFQFHFIDAVPVFWPKSSISHDHRPKRAYYQMAQINQPVVALPQLSGRRPDAVTLWIANDLADLDGVECFDKGWDTALLECLGDLHHEFAATQRIRFPVREAEPGG